VDYYGLPVRRIANDFLRLDYLVSAGPRIVRLELTDAVGNLLAETPDLGWETPYGLFRLYGGHRLWIAPELFPDTSHPDNEPVIVQDVPDGVRLCQPSDPERGLTKCIEVRLSRDAPALTLEHRVTNDGKRTRELAAWAITLLPSGGAALLPVDGALRADLPLGPNRHLVFWKYSKLGDPRMELGDAMVVIHARPAPAPFKVGYLNLLGWAGYWRDRVLVVKQFEPHAAQVHPDWNCNVEVYTNGRYLELETLAPLTRLEPGMSTRHIERWHVYDNVLDLDAARTQLALLNTRNN
jgi:hypothetical protein